MSEQGMSDFNPSPLAEIYFYSHLIAKQESNLYNCVTGSRIKSSSFIPYCTFLNKKFPYEFLYEIIVKSSFQDDMNYIDQSEIGETTKTAHCFQFNMRFQ